MPEGTESRVEFGDGRPNRLASLDPERLDQGVTALVLLSILGLLLDIRSHMEGLNFEEEGFVTPEHSVIYGGVFAAMALLAGVVLARRSAGATWSEAVPDGYGLGVLGLVLFAAGGPADFVWHSLFGAEANVEALVSPTHLLLATGGALFMTSPMRAAWHRESTAGWRRQFSVVVPATLTLTLFTAFTLYSHPAVGVPGTETDFPGYGLLSVQFHAALLMGFLLLLADRFRLAPGACTVLIGGNGAAMTLLGQSTELLFAYLLAGLFGDLLYAALEPSVARPRSFRLFATAVPAALTALHFASVALTHGLAWTVHLWVGAVFLAGAVGLLVSYLVVPSARRAPRRSPW